MASMLGQECCEICQNFGVDFVLETDTSHQGLGAVLSQRQEDGKLHPIAYASCALSGAEKNYGITDLETLAVVWAISSSGLNKDNVHLYACVWCIEMC